MQESSDLSQTPNAVRVELKTSSTSPIQTLFARVQGQETISISSAATAVQLPRRGVFLVDLSRHSHNETHISYPVASSSLPNPEYGTFGHPRFAGEYVYKPTNNCITPWTTLCPNRLSCNFNAGGTGASPTDLYTTIYNGRYRVGFSWVNYLIDDRLGAISAKTTHYKSDYVCFNTNPYVDTLPTAPLTTPTTINYPNPPADSGSSYLVDNYYGLTDTGETYDGAEPLNTMLVGINEAVKQFKENIVPSDEITVIGFDGSASIDIRTIGPLAINPLDPTFQELENLSDISLADPANGNHSDYLNSRFEKHMFFPRVHSNGDDRQKKYRRSIKTRKRSFNFCRQSNK